MSPRLSLLATLALVAPACGGGDLDPDAAPDLGGDCGCVVDAAPDAEPPDAEPPDAEPPMPVCTGDAGAGATYALVIDAIDVPETSDEAQNLGRDLDGDGTVDNQLGNILSALTQAGGGVLDAQVAITASVDRGETLLLATLSPCSPTSQAFATYAGANPNPAACDGPTDTTCRGHLDGNGTFEVAKSSPLDLVTPGLLAGGTFTGGPGELVFQLALPGAAPVDLELVATRVVLDDVTATGFGASVLAGAIPEAQLEARVIPAMHASIVAAIAADCTGAGQDCGCEPDSTGLTLLGIFDDDQSCSVTLAEIQENDLINTLFRPDVDTDDDGDNDALSLGVGITAVAASFTVPQAP